MDAMKEIRQFAIKNKYSLMKDGKPFLSDAYFWFCGQKIYNPWKSLDGYPLTTIQAMDLYGCDNVDLFCNKAEKYIKRIPLSNPLKIPELPKELPVKELIDSEFDEDGGLPAPWMLCSTYELVYGGMERYQGRRLHSAYADVLFVPYKDGKIWYFPKDYEDPFSIRVDGKYFAKILDLCFDRFLLMDFRVNLDLYHFFKNQFGFTGIKFYVVEYGFVLTDKTIPYRLYHGKKKERKGPEPLPKEEVFSFIKKDLDVWDLSENTMNNQKYTSFFL